MCVFPTDFRKVTLTQNHEQILISASILAPFWDPFGLQDRPKIGPKIHQKLSCSNMPPQDRPERPQDRPKSSQDHPKSSQDHPQSPPNSPKRAQNPPERLQDRPKKPPRPSQSNPFSIVLNHHYLLTKHKSWKYARSHQEDPRSCQDQHIRSSELRS